MINKLLPSYVGSKSYWIPYLKQLNIDKTKIVELFCGSAVISFNLSNKIILNDLDKPLIQFLKEFSTAKIIDPFTINDYLKVRNTKDWYKWLFCLQKMSFSGVYRWSKNGYNVPPKRNLKQVSVSNEYSLALKEYFKKDIKIFNKSYLEIDANFYKNSCLILDPPYETSKAAYNKQFDYHQYWEFIRLTESWPSSIILFDKEDNLPFKEEKSRIMAVNGKHSKNTEGIFIFKDSLKAGHEGEKRFHSKYPNLKRLDGLSGDFKLDDLKIELKSDYYDTNKTENFFIERYSNKELKTPGGPWKALKDKSDLFVYYFPKNNLEWWFVTEDLTKIVNLNQYKTMEVPNKGYTTFGYLVPRKDIEHLKLEI